MSEIIDMSLIFDDNCCICLELTTKCKYNIQLKCCKNYLHNQCLILLLLNYKSTCPLCRMDIKITDYYDKNNFDEEIKCFSYEELSLYRDAIWDFYYILYDNKFECIYRYILFITTSNLYYLRKYINNLFTKFT